MTEADLVRKILKALRSNYPGGTWYKIHTGPFQERGIPDILGCYRGRFIAMEVKCPENPTGPTQYQDYQLKRIIEAGGQTFVIRSVQEALTSAKRVRPCL